MKINFNVTGEQRKALVAAISEIAGWAPVYKKAPTFAYVVNNYTIDKLGALEFDERTSVQEVKALLDVLALRGFVSDDSALLDETTDINAEEETLAEDALNEIDSPNVNTSESASSGDSDGEENDVPGEDSAFSADYDKGLITEVEHEQTLEDSTQSGNVPDEPNEVFASRAYNDDNSGMLVIEVPLTGFTQTAFDNLEKLVTGKAALIMKAIGVPESPADDLPIHQTESTLRFPWFPLPLSAEAVDAYAKFVCALCDMAKKQKRVTLKDKEPDPDSNDKFAFRCFLLRLGFMGDEYKSARRVLLSKLSGSGSFKRGNHKRGTSPEGATTADSGEESTNAITGHEYGNDANNALTSGEEAVSPSRCGECPHHCYYTVGLLRTSAGDVVDISNRTPATYTHYCLGTSSGLRKIKHATDWSGSEAPPSWCHLLTTANFMPADSEVAVI